VIDLKNDMENQVHREIDRRKGARFWVRRRICWCPQCEADISALALNQLPPRYCRAANLGYAASEGYGAKVAAAVDQAILKVNQRPRHRSGGAVKSASDTSCEDHALKVGRTLVGTAFSALGGVCSCDDCRADALALALNRYRTKYGVASPGRPSYQENFSDFTRHEIGELLASACRVVSTNPHR